MMDEKDSKTHRGKDMKSIAVKTISRTSHACITGNTQFQAQSDMPEATRQSGKTGQSQNQKPSSLT